MPIYKKPRLVALKPSLQRPKIPPTLTNSVLPKHCVVKTNAKVFVGIMSFNRYESLDRLLKSLVGCRATIIVSDDCSTDKKTCQYLDDLEKSGSIVIIRNKERLGIAKNSNRLLVCSCGFDYAFILNDDVEILSDNWIDIYINISNDTGLRHLVHHYSGVYNHTQPIELMINSTIIWDVKTRPQGAVLFFVPSDIDVVGYFNTEYGEYGCEHVDWSMKFFEFKLQPKGFFAPTCSQSIIKLHKEQTAVQNRTTKLTTSKAIFRNRKIAFRYENN